jgi:ABC-type lipoprotein release transport system permease subunit
LETANKYSDEISKQISIAEEDGNITYLKLLYRLKNQISDWIGKQPQYEKGGEMSQKMIGIIISIIVVVVIVIIVVIVVISTTTKSSFGSFR